ncbi:DUF2523 family protein [Dyella sp. 2RAB6]|uniref:DUF2523 family protein n=1 Tax=Dyella sp. 2RAB6 TaxID=3232992 RepID=UPI003F92C29C
MWAILRKLAGLLLGGTEKMLSTRLGRWFAAAMAFLGISFGVTRGVRYVTDTIISDGLSQMPSQLIGWLSYLNFDAGVAVIMAAYAAVAGIKAATGGLLKLQARNAAASIPNGTHN